MAHDINLNVLPAELDGFLADDLQRDAEDLSESGWRAILNGATEEGVRKLHAAALCYRAADVYEDRLNSR